MPVRTVLLEQDADNFEAQVLDLKRGLNRVFGIGVSIALLIIAALAAQAFK